MSARAAERRAERERELAAHIARVVDAAPPLTRAQCDALALLFRPRTAPGVSARCLTSR